MSHPLVDEARRSDYIRETTANHGLRVNGIQIWSGGRDGDSWCMEFVWFVIDRVTKGDVPFPREQSVQAFRELAKKNGWEVDAADTQEGDIVVSVDANDHGHHVGIETAPAPLMTIAGNTDETGTSSNGTGVFEHAINPKGKEFFRVPLRIAA